MSLFQLYAVYVDKEKSLWKNTEETLKLDFFYNYRALQTYSRLSKYRSEFVDEHS